MAYIINGVDYGTKQEYDRQQSVETAKTLAQQQGREAGQQAGILAGQQAGQQAGRLAAQQNAQNMELQSALRSIGVQNFEPGSFGIKATSDFDNAMQNYWKDFKSKNTGFTAPKDISNQQIYNQFARFDQSTASSASDPNKDMSFSSYNPFSRFTGRK